MSFSIQTEKPICVPIGVPIVNGEYSGPREVEGDLVLNNCTSLETLPENLKVGRNLHLIGCTALQTLGNNLKVGGNLYLEGCRALTTLPDNLTTVGGYLNLIDCTALTTLPGNLTTVGGYLNLGRCRALQTLPENLKVGRNLHLYYCEALTTLPENLSVGGNLDLSWCTALKVIPPSVICQGTIKHTFKDEDLIYKIDLLNLSIDQLVDRIEYKLMSAAQVVPEEVLQHEMKYCLLDRVAEKNFEWFQERVKFLGGGAPPQQLNQTI